MWEKSRLICSSLRELQEEHRKGVLSFTMHKAPIGASECRLTSRRVILGRQGVWFLGIGLCQVSKWESNTYKLRLCGSFYFCIYFGFFLYPEVFEAKWKLQTCVGSSPWVCLWVCGNELSGQDGPYHSNLCWIPYHRPLSCILRSLGLPIMLRHWNEKPSKLHLCTPQLHGEGFLGKNAVGCLRLPAGALGLLQHLQCPCSNSRLAGAEPAGAMVCAAGQESMGRSRGQKNSILAPRFLL